MSNNEIYESLKQSLIDKADEINNSLEVDISKKHSDELSKLREYFTEVSDARKELDDLVENLYITRHNVYSSMLSASVARYYAKKMKTSLDTLNNFINAKNALNVTSTTSSLGKKFLEISDILNNINNVPETQGDNILTSLRAKANDLQDSLKKAAKALGYSENISVSISATSTDKDTSEDAITTTDSLYGYDDGTIINEPDGTRAIKVNKTITPGCKAYSFSDDKGYFTASVMLDKDISTVETEKAIEQFSLELNNDLLLEDGSSSAPYLIYTKDDMVNKGMYDCDGDTYYRLMADIEVLAPENLVLNDEREFFGTFDGNFHTIKTNYPFFNIVSGDIKNLVIEVVEGRKVTSTAAYSNPYLLSAGGLNIEELSRHRIELNGSVTNCKAIIKGDPRTYKYGNTSGETLIDITDRAYLSSKEVVFQLYAVTDKDCAYRHKIDITPTTRKKMKTCKLLYDENPNSLSEQTEIEKYYKEGTQATAKPLIEAGSTLSISSTGDSNFILEDSVYKYQTSSTFGDGSIKDVFFTLDEASKKFKLIGEVSIDETVAKVNLSGSIKPASSSVLIELDKNYATIFNMAELVSALKNATMESLKWEGNKFGNLDCYKSYPADVISNLVATTQLTLQEFRKQADETITQELKQLNSFKDSYTSFETFRQTNDSNYTDTYILGLNNDASTITGYIDSLESTNEDYETSPTKTYITDAIERFDSDSYNVFMSLADSVETIEKYIDTYSPFFKIDSNYSDRAKLMMDTFDAALKSSECTLPQYTRPFAMWSEKVKTYSDDGIFSFILMYIAQELGMNMNNYSVLESSSDANMFRRLFNHALRESLNKKLFDTRIVSDSLIEVLDAEKFLMENYNLRVIDRANYESSPSSLKSLVKELSSFDYIDLGLLLKDTMNSKDLTLLKNYVKTIFIKEIYSDKSKALDKIIDINYILNNSELTFKSILLKIIFKELVYSIYHINLNKENSIFNSDELETLKIISGIWTGIYRKEEDNYILVEANEEFDSSAEYYTYNCGEYSRINLTSIPNRADTSREEDMLYKYIAVWCFYNNDSNNFIIALKNDKSDLYQFLLNPDRTIITREEEEEELSFWEKLLRLFRLIWNKIKSIFGFGSEV